MLQEPLSELLPTQSRPPPDGGGLLHARVLLWMPPPQVCVQVLQSPHWPQLPFTASTVTRQNKLAKMKQHSPKSKIISNVFFDEKLQQSQDKLAKMKQHSPKSKIISNVFFDEELQQPQDKLAKMKQHSPKSKIISNVFFDEELQQSQDKQTGQDEETFLHVRVLRQGKIMMTVE